MKKQLLLAGVWTMSMACVCQGAENESKNAIQDLKMLRKAISESAASPDSKRAMLAQLEERIQSATATGVKGQRVLRNLQHRVEQDTDKIFPTTATKQKVKRQLFA